METTLSIIKPDAVERKLIGKIIALFEKSNLKVQSLEMRQLSISEAEGFYAEHRERPFFAELTNYISSSPVVIMAISGEDAIQKNRNIMGATNPHDATPGTIRALYGKSITENSVHGSDSKESAERELKFFNIG